MSVTKSKSTLSLLIIALLGPAATAYAGSPQTTLPHAKATSSTLSGWGKHIDAATLAQLSGGTNITQNVKLTGSISNTSTQNVTTGFNAISGGAFGNAAGLPMVIQNSGNSVLIQNATTVNLQLQP